MAGRLKIYNANTSQWEYTSADFSSNVTQILNEVPSGLVNSSNTAYTTASTYVSGSLKVFKNGIRLKGSGNDYTESAGGFTMIVAPATGTTLLVDYNVSTGIYSTGVNTFEPLQIPAGTVNGTNAVFTCAKSYIGSTLQVYINGVLQAPTTHYVETTPSTGVFTMGDAPLTGDNILVTYQHEFAASGDADTVDGIHASATPTANQLLPLNASAKVPLTVMGFTKTVDAAGWTAYNYGTHIIYKKYVSGTVTVAGNAGATIGAQTLPTGVTPNSSTHFAEVVFTHANREVNMSNGDTDGTGFTLHARNNMGSTFTNMTWSAIMTITTI